jgi:hypothetical protein
MFDVIYYNNDTVIRMSGVKNSLTGNAINDAVVEVTGIKKYGTEDYINPEMFPLSLDYQAGTVGMYSGVLSHTIELVPNTKYVCMIEATTIDNIKGYWEFSFTCRQRQD